jgi:hypothetical protein
MSKILDRNECGSVMILEAYIIRGNGDTLYGISYQSESVNMPVKLPAHVRGCVTLFHSRESTNLEGQYTLEQQDNVWAYTFFESFAVVVLVTKDEDLGLLKQRMVSLGKSVAHSYGRIVGSWNGDLGAITDLKEVVDQYMKYDLESPSKEALPYIEQLVDSALQKPGLVYVGIFDASGDMILGNIPDAHMSYLQEAIENVGVRVSLDIVPVRLDILGYHVQLLRARSLTVAVAAHKDENQLNATQVASELAHALIGLKK